MPRTTPHSTRSRIAPRHHLVHTQTERAMYRKTVLANGLRIVTETIPWVRSCAIGAWIDAGSRDETPAQNGIAHFIEHAVFKGTETRKTHQIAQYLEAVGGYVNAFTGKDSTCYYARVLDRHADRAITLLADLVGKPSFPEREIEREKQVIIDEMRSVDDDPEDVINDHFEQLLFGSHALSMPVIGTEQTVRGLSRGDLAAFTRTHYTAAATVIAASGNIDHDALVVRCAEAFDLPAGTAVVRARPRSVKPRTLELRRSVQQAHIVMGRVVQGLRAPTTHALALLNAALGEGMSSRLFQRVREKAGYSYNVYSFTNLFEDVGVFAIYAGGETGNIDRMRRVIERELDDLVEHSLSARELNRAREQVAGSLLLGLESMSTRMNRLGRDELVFGYDTPIDRILEELYAVTPVDVQALAAHACDHRAYTSVVIVPDGRENADD